MQIYTRVGDKGQTKINGNYTVNKDSVRVEAYGVCVNISSETCFLKNKTLFNSQFYFSSLYSND